ncbi:MAG: NAD-dependent epimerase/dehydratase family protein [Syntrophorhabdus sp.]
MNILVTGATGFIGRRLVERLLDAGHSCRCLVRQTKGLESVFYRPNVSLFVGDVTDLNSLQDIGNNIDAAYHLAGAGHVSAVSGRETLQSFNINVGGTRNLVRACGLSSVRRVIHFSSTAAMGLIKRPKIDENSKCRPRTPCQKSKYASEIAALQESKKYGTEVVILRPCMVFGPGCKSEFLKFCRLVNKGIFPRIGLGKNLTPIVHVNDVVQAAVKALQKGKPGEVYIIASRESPPLQDIHRFICAGLDISRPYFYVPVWVAYMAAFFMEHVAAVTGKEPLVSRMNITSTITGRTFDIQKAMKELSYCPEMDLGKAISQTARHFRAASIL